MTILTPTTELEAVNFMLATIGEAPVNALGLSGLVDSATAATILGQVCREVQSRSWQFNFEKEYSLARDINNKVPLPTNTLRVTIADSMVDANTVVQRGMFLYDPVNHTFVFTQTMKVDILFLLTFEDMPECARWYVTVRAARQFLDKTVGAQAEHKYSSDDEAQALGVLKEFEGDTGDYNILTGSYDVFRTLDRNAPFTSTIINQ